MESTPTERTPAVVAGEIAAIKAQTRKILLVSAVEVGRRLMEAKEMIPYGEFCKWLEEAVDYSERVAYKLMRIAEEYGPGLSVLSEADVSNVPFARLGYSQAFALLGIPAEERAEFIAQLDIEHMSVSALQQVIKDRNEALEEKTALAKKLKIHQDKVSGLAEERDQAKKEAEAKEQALWSEQSRVTQLQRELTVLQNDSVAARRMKEIERERDIAKINHAMAQADARYDLIVKGFDDLFSTIREMAGADPNAYKLFVNQTSEFIAKTARKLKRIKKNAQTAPTEQAVPEAPAPETP
ncbi:MULTISPECIES: DUF3102 domain-containing protein [Dehalobacter]|jgi:hypothetical protein|uniref:DUF3102 domain-containing protein n=1 Tax=Dehalobacter restrictus TaxID=55583 RepID=A0A857DIX2_9FIRM|nr:MULTISPECIES: DUF3102 domain-containing protein [Dehalobacter]MCG1025636.1 DUF3102 domain-containing protein [Dehalobacter sp.]OCZ51554.1 preprotein translocase subunit SecA [Dehalobacter sp. TeCB1]QHA00295.1 DUF3102 domain-containing protein [Dehalobacter restrictus]